MDQYPTPHERAEAFDRQICIRGVLAEERRVTMLSLSLGESIEERYLADEVVYGERYFETHLTSMETTTEAVRQRTLAAGDVTPDAAVRYSGEAYQTSRRAVGGQILDFAQQSALSQALSPTDMASLITFDRPQNPAELGSRLVESAKKGYADFYQKGWSTFPTADGPMLVMLAEASETTEDDVFHVVHLDQLFAADPELLKKIIREHHEVEAGHAIIESAVHQARYHEVALGDVVPQFMADLAAIEDPEQRRQEVKNILSYLDFMWAVMREGSPVFRVGQIDHDRRHLGRFQDKLRSISVKFEDGRFIFPEAYLKHLSQCPGQPEAKREAVNDVLELHTHVQQLDSRAPILAPDIQRFVPVLEMPYKHMNSQGDETLRQLGEAFRIEAGITNTDLELIERVSERDVSDIQNELLKRMSRIGHYIYTYTPLFNALALHRQGFINLNSPVFRSFLQTFIGRKDAPDLSALPTIS